MKERAMVRYSEDNLGGRALNWVMIGGAAVLFALVTFASFSPQSVAPEQQTVAAPAGHSTHA
jgi:hypothetical protein